MDINEMFLEKVIQISGNALENEDRYIAGCIINNPDIYTKKESIE